jgi:hypothetical protein
MAAGVLISKQDIQRDLEKPYLCYYSNGFFMYQAKLNQKTISIIILHLPKLL